MTLNLKSAQDDEGRRRRRAIVDLINWMDSDATAKALEAIDLLELTDEELERIFRGDARVKRIPHLGRVT